MIGECRFGAAALVMVMIEASVGCAGEGGGADQGNLAYYCEHRSQAFCPAYLDCDPYRFAQAFRNVEECVEQTERDCLDPPQGISVCVGATEDEADGCRAYIESNHPEGCANLFGPTADMGPCDGICD